MTQVTGNEPDTWNDINEVQIVLSEQVVQRKFHELTRGLIKDPTKIAVHETQEATPILRGLVDGSVGDQKEFNQKAISQWTNELVSLCTVVTDSETSFEQSLKKRVEVQKYFHEIVREEKKAKLLDESHFTKSNVPAVVRLGVLTLFPLIESLSGIKEANYQRLCSRTLEVIISVIDTLPPLALHDEPSDCLDVFNDFIFNLVKGYNYDIDNHEKAQAMIALVGLALSRGGANNILQAVDCLFKVHRKQQQAATDSSSMTRDEFPLKVGHLLQQLGDHSKDSDVPVLNDRSFLDSWRIDCPGVRDGKIDYESTSIAANGSYIFIYNKEFGLLKVGTGYNNTVQAHVYKSAPAITKSDSSPCIALVVGKLILYSPELQISNQSSTARRVVMQVFDPRSLERKGDFKLVSPNGADPNDIQMTNDNQFLYLISRKRERGKTVVPETTADVPHALHQQLQLQEQQQLEMMMESFRSFDNKQDDDGTHSPSGDTESEDDQDLEIEGEATGDDVDEDSIPDTESGNRNLQGSSYVVEIYNMLSIQDGKDLTPERTIELRGAEIHNIGDRVKRYDSALLSSDFTYGSFFTNGINIFCAFSLDNIRKGAAYHLNKCRAFSLRTGHFVSENSVKGVLGGTVLTFDGSTNCIWGYNNHKQTITSWFNCGITYTPSIHREFTPEYYLHKEELSLKVKGSKEIRSLKPDEIIMFILSNMDRLSRKHQMYNQCSVVNFATPPRFSMRHSYPVDGDPRAFEFLPSIFDHVIVQSKLNPASQSTMSYVIISCLRILKVNLHDAIVYSKSFSKLCEKSKLRDGVTVMNTLRDILLGFVNKPPFEQGSTIVQQEAINALTIGFLLFYRRPTEQIQFLLTLFEDVKKTKSHGLQLLLSTLLDKLAQFPRVSDMLLEESREINREGKKEKKDKQTKEEKILITNNFAKKLLLQLVDYLVEDSGSKIATYKLTHAVESNSPILNPALRLLLVLQRDVLAGIFGRQFLIEYVNMTLQTCTSLLNDISTNHKELFLVRKDDDSGLCPFDQVLQDSIIGVLLRALLTALCRPKFFENVEFVVGLFNNFVNLIGAVDNVNSQLSSAKSSDGKYLAALSPRKEKTALVETKHPYTQSKQPVKETITFPGAQGLVLYFDPQCRTSSSGDALQLFIGPSLEQAVLINGSPSYFSGQNFPLQPIVIHGETVTFLFTASSRIDTKTMTNDKLMQQRWGFRCIIKEMALPNQAPISHWHLYLEATLAYVCGKYASTLLAGEPVSETEKNYQGWLESTLLRGGLEELAAFRDADSARWISSFVDEPESEAALLYHWIKQQNRAPLLQPAASKVAIDQVERYTIATILKHMNLIKDSAEASKLLALKQQIPGDWQAKFKLIGKKATTVSSWVLRRGQTEKAWQIAVSERADISYFDAYKQNPQTLGELCEMKHVEFDLMDTEETIKLLYNKLKDNIEAARLNPDSPSINAYEVIANPVLERLKFLLRVVPSFAHHPSARSVNPFSLSQIPTLELHSSQPDITEFNMSQEQAALSRSLSEIPVTITSAEIQRRKARDVQKELAFTKRVGELRKWLHAYDNWKSWQEGSLLVRGLQEHATPPASPIQAISSFAVASTILPKELEKLVQTHVSRAKARIQGLTHLNDVIKKCSFGSVRHQVLLSVQNPLVGGGHYLDDISTCGRELSVKVEHSFSLFFESMMNILGQPSVDSTSRLLALRICSLRYRDIDVHLLTSSKIFTVLCAILAEKDIVLAQQKQYRKSIQAQSAATIKQQEVEDEEDAGPMTIDTDTPLINGDVETSTTSSATTTAISTTISTATSSATTTATTSTSAPLSLSSVTSNFSDKVAKKERDEHEEEFKRKLTLCQAAWTAFRLLAIECTNWTLGAPTPQVLQLQGTVCDLLCAELQRLSKNSKIHSIYEHVPADNEDGNLAFELLSLLHSLIIGNSSRMKAMSNPQNIKSLVSFLGTNTAPRAQRLVLRLCRRLLPHSESNPEKIAPILNILLEELGKWLCPGEPSFRSSTELDSENMSYEDESDSDSVEETLNPAAQGVYLHSWGYPDKVLVEACTTALGPDFQFDSRGTNPPSTERNTHALRARAQEIIQEMATSGSSLVKSGSQDQMIRLATTLCSLGSIVTVSGVMNKDQKKKRGKHNPNIQQTSKWPTFWVDGSTAAALASEYVALLRFLSKVSNSSTNWNFAIKSAVRKHIDCLPQIFSPKAGTKIPTSTYRNVLSALSIIGGFQEDIRVGGRVISTHAGESKYGTVNNYDTSASRKAEVILDGEESAQKIEIKDLIAVPEFEVDSTILLEIAGSIIPPLLSVISPSDVPQNLLLMQVKSRSLSALVQVLSQPETVRLLLNTQSASIGQIVSLARKCDQLESKEQLTNTCLQLTQLLWNATTSPRQKETRSKASMASILPYLPDSTKTDSLPICFEHTRNQGVLFLGDKRKIEFVGVTARVRTAPRGGPSSTALLSSASRSRSNGPQEIIILGNTSIPPNLSYYFEILVDKAESSAQISIGFCPEGSTTWGTGSYRFKNDKVKQWYSRGSSKKENYGARFTVKNVVGCGYDNINKIIYFTKDGEDLGSAFTGITSLGDRMFPAVSVTKGVRLFANFGQDAFKYKLTAEEIDEATRELKRKEAEEKRRKEIEEEELRRKKEKEAERARRIQQAQPIMNAGFTLKQALKALEVTRGGVDAAVNWLLENSEFPFDDEETEEEKPPSSQPQLQPPAQPQQPPAPQTQTQQPPSAPLSTSQPATSTATTTTTTGTTPTLALPRIKTEPMDVDTPATGKVEIEKNYRTAASSTFSHSSCFDFDDPGYQPAKISPSISPEWEARVIPNFRSFMEADGFSSFEIGEYIQQMRNALNDSNEEEAANIFRQIYGESHSFLLPTKRDDEFNLKIESLKKGDKVQIKQFNLMEIPMPAAAIWVHAMDSTPGRVGSVEGIDLKNQVALVRLHNVELANLEEWWFPVSVLSKVTKKEVPPTKKIESDAVLRGQLLETESKLASTFARRAVLSLLRHVNLSDGPLDVMDLLHLASGEFLSSPANLISTRPLLTSSADKSESGMDFFRRRLQDVVAPSSAFISTNDQNQRLTDLLSAACTKSFTEAQKLGAQQLSIVSDASKLGIPVLCEITTAQALFVMFERASIRIQGNGTTLEFFADEECTIPIKSFEESAPLTPFLISSHKFYHRFSSKSVQTTCKLKFNVVPTTTQFALGRWLFEFLLAHCLESRNFAQNLRAMANAILDCIYSIQTPVPLKEVMFSLLSHMLHQLRRRFHTVSTTSVPLERLTTLHEEMTHLYETDRKKTSLVSSYLQSLVDLLVSVKLYKAQITKTKKKLPSSASKLAKDEELLAAIAIAKTLERAKIKKQGGSPSTATTTSTTTTTATTTTSATAAATSTTTSTVSTSTTTTTPATTTNTDTTTTTTTGTITDTMTIPVATTYASTAATTTVPSTTGESGPMDVDMDDEMKLAILMSLGQIDEVPASKENTRASASPDKPVSPNAASSTSDTASGAFFNEVDDQDPGDGDIPEDMDRSTLQSYFETYLGEEGTNMEFGDREGDEDELVDNDLVDFIGDDDGVIAPEDENDDENEDEYVTFNERPPASPAYRSVSPPRQIPEPSVQPPSTAQIPAPLSSPSPSQSPSTTTPAAATQQTPPAVSTPTTPATSATTTPSSTAKKLSKNSKDGWFSNVVHVAQTLECFYYHSQPQSVQSKLPSKAQQYHLKIFRDLIKKAWKETAKNESIRDRLAIVNNLPSVVAKSRDEMVTVIEEFFDEIQPVEKGRTWLPVTSDEGITESWCVVEFRSAEKLYELPSKLVKAKLKLPPTIRAIAQSQSAFSPSHPSSVSVPPATTSTSTSTSSATAPSTSTASVPSTPSTLANSSLISSKKEKYFQVKTFKEIDFSSNHGASEFLKSLIYSEQNSSLTPSCKAMLTEVFIDFAGSEDGILGPRELDALQLVSNKEHLTKEQTDYVLEKYETKVLPRSRLSEPEPEQSGVRGISLNGFMQLYASQATSSPVETWQEFHNLGYDYHFTKNHFSSLEAAEKAVFAATKRRPKIEQTSSPSRDSTANDKNSNLVEILEQIIKYTESIFMESSDFNKPTAITPSHVSPIRSTEALAITYPLLVDMEPAVFRLLFEIIRYFNSKLSQVLPLINLEGTSVLAQYIFDLRALIFHSTKMEYFYDVLGKTSCDKPAVTVSYNRLKLAARNEKRDPNKKLTEQEILKYTAFGKAYKQLRNVNPVVFRQKKPQGTAPHCCFIVNFKGEDVAGEGGPYRQFFTDVAKELLHGGLPLLVPCPNAQAKLGDNRDKFVLSPSARSRAMIRMYRFLGQLMGMSIRTGTMLTLDLPPFVWKPLVGLPVTRADLKAIDHSFHGWLKYLAACPHEELEGENRTIFEKFEIPLSDKTTTLLKKNGSQIELSASNREEYIQLAEHARLTESRIQTMAVLKGLCEVIPKHMLPLLTYQDLEWRVGGKPKIDIKLLKRHTEYSEVSPASPHIVYFWQVLNSFTQEERRAFIRFAWGQERLPSDDQEFRRTGTRMLIKPFSGLQNPDNAFPKADTCFFNLMLPEYSSAEILRQKLLFAIFTDSVSMNADQPREEDDPNVGSHQLGLGRGTMRGILGGALPFVPPPSGSGGPVVGLPPGAIPVSALGFVPDFT